MTFSHKTDRGTVKFSFSESQTRSYQVWLIGRGFKTCFWNELRFGIVIYLVEYYKIK